MTNCGNVTFDDRTGNMRSFYKNLRGGVYDALGYAWL